MKWMGKKTQLRPHQSKTLQNDKTHSQVNGICGVYSTGKYPSINRLSKLKSKKKFLTTSEESDMFIEKLTPAYRKVSE